MGTLLCRRRGNRAVHDIFLKVLILGQGAHGFAHGVGTEFEGSLRRPGFRVGLGVVNRHIELQGIVTGTPEAFDQVQRVAVWMSDHVQPALVVQAHRVDNQSIAIVFADGISTWLGDSVGKYDGDALVIDTVGLNDKSWLDMVGHPHSDALHLIERFRRASHDALQLDMTIDDPKAYTKSWTAQRTFKFSSDPMGETMCSLSENQDFQKNIMDRTIPATPAK